jgi:hypothetical protein
MEDPKIRDAEFTEKNPIEPAQEPISKTYAEMATEWVAQEAEKFVDDGRSVQAIDAFAKWLDSMPHLFPHLELLVMKQARKIDREFLEGMIEALGIERAKEIARKVNARHGRTERGNEGPVLRQEPGEAQ